MSKSNVSYQLPLTANERNCRDHINLITGIMILLLILWAGTAAVFSDFDGKRFILPSHGKRIILHSKDKNLSIPDYSNSFGGKGVILAPPHQLLDFTVYVDEISASSISTAYDTTTYISSELVDRPPELVWMLYPRYSPDGQHDTVSVHVVLNILVDQSGQASEVVFAEKPTINHGLTQVVLKSAKTSVFKPAVKNNQPVRCWIQFPLEILMEA